MLQKSGKKSSSGSKWNTGNPALDALLNIKLSEMKQNGIDCTPEITIPQNLDIPFSDVVTLLGYNGTLQAECSEGIYRTDIVLYLVPYNC